MKRALLRWDPSRIGSAPEIDDSRSTPAGSAANYERRLTSPASISWPAVLVVLGGANLLVALTTLPLLAEPTDWWIFEQLPTRLAAGTLHQAEPGYNWVYSVAAAWLVTVLVLPLGYQVWFGLHAVSLALLRDWRLAIICLCALPFWIDGAMGNAFVFVVVSAVLAASGSKPATYVYLGFCVLMPRPLQMPLALWLVWSRPYARLPLAAMVFLTLVAVVMTGYADDWLHALLPFTQSLDWRGNLGPTRIFGLAWLPIGLVGAVWFGRRKRFGLAGLAISPYVGPTYFLFLLVDVMKPAGTPDSSAVGHSRQRA